MVAVGSTTGIPIPRPSSRATWTEEGLTYVVKRGKCCYECLVPLPEQRYFIEHYYGGISRDLCWHCEWGVK